MTNVNSDPWTRIESVTPSDSADLPGGTCKYLLVGVEGNVSGIGPTMDAAVTFPVQVGYVPASLKRVRSTGTTATSIFACYID